MINLENVLNCAKKTDSGVSPTAAGENEMCVPAKIGHRRILDKVIVLLTFYAFESTVEYKHQKTPGVKAGRHK